MTPTPNAKLCGTCWLETDNPVCRGEQHHEDKPAEPETVASDKTDRTEIQLDMF